MNLRATAKSSGHSATRIDVLTILGLCVVSLSPFAIIWLWAVLTSSDVGIGVMLALTVVPFALYGLYRLAGHSQPWLTASTTWMFGVLLFGIEFVAGFVLLLVGAPVYLLLAAGGIVLGIWVAYKVTYD